MAQLLNHAQPGDVITAEDWNLVVDAINELLQAGQTSGIKINNLIPAATALDPLKIGSLVQVVGQNFGFSIGQSLSLIHISEPTRLLSISYAVFCLKKK